MLYDMTGQMATRLRTLLRCFWRRIIAPSRDMRLMADVSSSIGEDTMLWGGCTKHRVSHCKLFKNRQLLVHLRLDPVRSRVGIGPPQRTTYSDKATNTEQNVT